MDAARSQDSPEDAARPRVVSASNLCCLPSDSLVVEVTSVTTPWLTWPRSHSATVTPTGALDIVERGHVVQSFSAGGWSRVDRLINIHAEHRSVVVIELDAGAA